MDIPFHKAQLFRASCIALIATAMTFAIRANLIGPLGLEFQISSAEMGIVFGTAFWGFTLSMILGGTLCDLLGMKRLLLFAFLGHLSGLLLTLYARDFWTLFASTLLVGVANGFVEAACNPLIASLYTDQKTQKLNQLHMWFPGGIVIGGLIAYACNFTGINWHWQIVAILIPVLGYGLLFFNQSFPVTERVSSGISTLEMVKACKKPLFLFMVGCMLLTAATELGTNQWIIELLSNVGVESILLLVFINGFMAAGRSFAGQIEHRLSPPGMLLFSAVFSAAGLFLLSHSNGFWAFGAAAIFAAGICFFWPTMLGFVSQYMPKTGALGLSVMGGAGMLSVSLILPLIGNVYDQQQLHYLPNGYALDKLSTALSGTQEYLILQNVKLAAGASTLRYVTLLPVVLIAAFSWLYYYISAQRKSTTSI